MLAVVKKDMVGNGALTKLGLAEHVQQTSTKKNTMASACDVLRKPPPNLSLKTASVQVNYLGMEIAVSIAPHKISPLGCALVRQEHSGIKNQTSASRVQTTITAEGSPLFVPSVPFTRYQTQNPQNVHFVPQDTPGKTTPALNVQMIMSETELPAVFAQREPLHLKIRPSAKSPPLMSSLSYV